MSYTIYHNARCRKSRVGLQYLESKGIQPKIVEYLKDQPFTFESLKEIISKLGVKPDEILRKQEVDYKLNHKGKSYTDDEWIKIMIENPKLIGRPIIVKGNKAVFGDIVKHIDVLL